MKIQKNECPSGSNSPIGIYCCPSETRLQMSRPTGDMSIPVPGHTGCRSCGQSPRTGAPRSLRRSPSAPGRPLPPRARHTQSLWQLLYLLPSRYFFPLGLYNSVHRLFFNCNHSLSVSFFFFFFNFWDLSFQFNLLISVLISLCRLFADFTRHNFYQLVLKDA